jgi:hypothetical protein
LLLFKGSAFDAFSDRALAAIFMKEEASIHILFSCPEEFPDPLIDTLIEEIKDTSLNVKINNSSFGVKNCT